MNKCILMGNLTRDPEMRYSQGENSVAIARFSIAVNRRFTREGEDNADFFNCMAFGKQAEFVEKYFHKGSRMLLSGRIQNNNYTNDKGEKVYGVQVIAEEVEFAERKSTADANAANQGGNSGDVASQPNVAANDDFMKIPDGIEDGLPFN